MNYYAVYDSAGQEFLPMFEAKTDVYACRIVDQTIDRQKAQNMPVFPGDYTLYMIGRFDQIAGVFSPDKSLISWKYKETDNNE